MTIRILFQAGSRRQKGSLIGIFLLMLVAIMSLTIAVTLYKNAGAYVQQEMNRVGYGTFTAWIKDGEQAEPLQNEIEVQETIEKVSVQPLLFAGYELNGIHSDNDGELIAYEPESSPYYIFTDDLNGYESNAEILQGEIYVSPVMATVHHAGIGDQIEFELGRDGTSQIFTIAGYFEDPFMGSSMVDRKSFLISERDYAQTVQKINQVEEHELIASSGAMLHIFAKEPMSVSISELNQQLSAQTSIGNYIEAMYSAPTMHGFMLLLQNIVSGFLIAFSVLLLIVILIVAANSIRNAIEQEWKDIGILKTIGTTAKTIWIVKILEYIVPVVIGMVLGVCLAMPLMRRVSKQMVASIGVFVPDTLPAGSLSVICGGVLAVVWIFIALFARKVLMIRPMQAMHSEEIAGRGKRNSIQAGRLGLDLAVRQILFGWRRYIGVFLVMTLLTVFLSMIGRMSAWVGQNGEGLMNAFSVAEHDLGVQPMSSDVDMQEIEQVISSYTKITDTYELAMKNGTVNGVDRTINVLDEPEWFHILSGTTTSTADEVIVTEATAADLNVTIGDEVTVSSNSGSARYRISGIYECANEMGANIGMSRDGYARIGDVTANIWCVHYLLKDGELRDVIMQELMRQYRVEADIHTNSWSGLEGIVSTLHRLVWIMYAIAVFIICIVITLSSSKMLQFEQKTMAIYKGIGFSAHQLRIYFGLRYGLIALLGTVCGTLLSVVTVNRAISIVFRSFGIGEFQSEFSLLHMAGTAGFIIVFVIFFAVIASRKIKAVSVTKLLQSD